MELKSGDKSFQATHIRGSDKIFIKSSRTGNVMESMFESPEVNEWLIKILAGQLIDYEVWEVCVQMTDKLMERIDKLRNSLLDLPWMEYPPKWAVQSWGSGEPLIKSERRKGNDGRNNNQGKC